MGLYFEWCLLFIFGKTAKMFRCIQDTCSYPNDKTDALKCITEDCCSGIHFSCLGLKRNMDKTAREAIKYICLDCQQHISATGENKSIVIATFMTILNKISKLEEKLESQMESKNMIKKIANDCNSKFDAVVQSVDAIIVDKNKQDEIQEQLKVVISNADTKYQKILDRLEKLEESSNDNPIDTSLIRNTVQKAIELKPQPKKTERHSQTVENDFMMLNEPIGGWRMLGDRRVWRNDWRDYDRRKSRRESTEKLHQKKIRKIRKNKKQLNYKSISNKNLNSNLNSNFDRNSILNKSFRSKRPINANPKPQIDANYSNFVKGQTINPNSNFIDNLTNISCHSLSSSSDNSFQNNNASFKEIESGIDCLNPPIVKLTKNSDDRYKIARLRDPKIFSNVRLYLAYLHDKSETCIEGKTSTSLKVEIASEGLPTNVGELREVFLKYHETFGIQSKEVEADLESYRSHLSTQRLNYLQSSRVNFNNFQSGNKKNF